MKWVINGISSMGDGNTRKYVFQDIELENYRKAFETMKKVKDSHFFHHCNEKSF